MSAVKGVKPPPRAAASEKLPAPATDLAQRVSSLENAVRILAQRQMDLEEQVEGGLEGELDPQDAEIQDLMRALEERGVTDIRQATIVFLRAQVTQAEMARIRSERPPTSSAAASE